MLEESRSFTCYILFKRPTLCNIRVYKKHADENFMHEARAGDSQKCDYYHAW